MWNINALLLEAGSKLSSTQNNPNLNSGVKIAQITASNLRT